MSEDYLKIGNLELRGWKATSFSIAISLSYTIAAIAFGYMLGSAGV